MNPSNSTLNIPFYGRILDIAYINEENKAPFIGLTIELISDLIALPKYSEVLVFISEPKAMQILTEQMPIISKVIDSNLSKPAIFIAFSSHNIFLSHCEVEEKDGNNTEDNKQSPSMRMEIHLKKILKLKVRNQSYEFGLPAKKSTFKFKPSSWMINLLLSLILFIVFVVLMESVFNGNLLSAIMCLFLLSSTLCLLLSVVVYGASDLLKAIKSSIR